MAILQDMTHVALGVDFKFRYADAVPFKRSKV